MSRSKAKKPILAAIGLAVAAEEVPQLSNLPLTEAEKIIATASDSENGLIRLPTESEWLLITSRTNIQPLPFAWTSDEFHASRWGSPRDGRPWTEARCGPRTTVPTGAKAPRAAVTLRKETIHRVFPPGGIHSPLTHSIPVLIPDEEKENHPPPHPLPSRPLTNQTRVIEELIGFLIFGGAAMGIALYNSPDYALSQPLNILLGGLMVSLASGLIWRPSRPTIAYPLQDDFESE